MGTGQGDEKGDSGAEQRPSAKFRFTVLTPTYNRAHLLPNVYESLLAQTFRSFEWLIVDDGSTDGTRTLVSSWHPHFPIRYFWKENGGLHTCLNLGSANAGGEFIIQLDSDDRFLPRTLERLDFHWKQITEPHRYAQIIALCCHDNGSILGSPLQQNYIDTSTIREALALLDGDRCAITRTDVYRKFRFPEFKNERFLIPGLVWNRILKNYTVRHVNEPLYVAGYAEGHMSSRDLRWASPTGAALYHAELALSDVPVKMRLKSALNAARFSVVAAIKTLTRN